MFAIIWKVIQNINFCWRGPEDEVIHRIELESLEPKQPEGWCSPWTSYKVWKSRWKNRAVIVTSWADSMVEFESFTIYQASLVIKHGWSHWWNGMPSMSRKISRISCSLESKGVWVIMAILQKMKVVWSEMNIGLFSKSKQISMSK